ncbi:MAG: hypothetical protein LBH20_02005 [Treponema sp.]|jgi:hypothetical protein|nr:hypothetical protein [Treponema sp.]
MSYKTKNSAMLPRPSFSLFILDLPRLRGKALENAARNCLVGLYPDNLGDRPLVIKRNNQKKRSYLVFVLNPALPYKPLPVSTLFAMKYFCRGNASVLFMESNWMEFILIENGALVKSEVKTRDAAISEETIIRFFGKENNQQPRPEGQGIKPLSANKIDVFCHKNDVHLFSDNKHNSDIIIHILENELGKFPLYTYSIFDHLSIAKRIQRFFLIFFSLLVMGGISYNIYNQHQMNKKEILRTKLLEEEEKLHSEAEQKDRMQVLTLQERYRQLVEHKTAGPYETMDTISRCLDDKARISSITIKDGFFQMETQASDSLEILRVFEDTVKVQNPMLQQIHPLKNGERFTISGTVLSEKESIDTSLSTKEQIVILEALIVKEENKNHGKLRPSDFGVNIRGLLTKWRCSINAYQYLTVENDREIEFSIKATSGNFFSFLREASINNNGWIFTLVQIRNLAPQNAVDGLFRVRAETVVEDGTDTIEPYKESPVTGISRHFFIPPPPQPQVIKASPLPIPPPPQVKPEPAPWLAYIGVTSDYTGSQFIYVKNTRNGAMLRLENIAEGENRYIITPMGTIEAQIEGKLYEITRR